jgi:aldehyde:ferredoxin oxidoreductase
MQIWRINVKDQSLKKESPPSVYDRLGGRGLSARILLDEVPPMCDPLGPHNQLIFAPGLLSGHMLSSSDRISIGAKSPLTGGIKEANGGGTTSLKLTQLGIKALIVEGAPARAGMWLLILSQDGARFETASDLSGKGVYQTAELLRDRFGKKVAISLIGPGGELGLLSAGIQNLDKDGVPSRICARGGLGAVMGAKGLKAIVIDAPDSSREPVLDLPAYRQGQKEFNQALLAHPQTRMYADYGTAAMIGITNSLGGLPTRNFSQGNFEHYKQISAEQMRQQILERGGEGETTHACMPGCGVRCSNTFPDKDGKTIVSPLDYETMALMGSNLGINDLDMIARLNYEANDLGIDSIEIGAALGVFAQSGQLKFGDGVHALQLVNEIRSNSPVGRILGNGAALAGKVLGVRRIPVVKGQAMAAYDPRAIKGTGVTYATSPQGADHTAGLTIRAKVDHHSPEGQVELSRNAQINMAGYDSLGVCIFAGFGFATAPADTVARLLNARYGWQVGNDILQILGINTLALEREFNQRAGFTALDDRLPEWMNEEALPPNQLVFDVPDREMDTLFDW